MPGAERLTRKQRQARTRSSLMEAAARICASRGLQRTSIDEIAAAAGFTKGAFYANFASKEDLFLAMLEERFDERLGQIEALSQTDSAVEEQARAAGEDFARQLAGEPEWQRLFFEFAAHAGRDEGFRVQLVSRYSDLRDGIAAVFARRADNLDFSLPVQAPELALMTFAMANGYALERMLEPGEASEDLFGKMLVIFFAGLRAMAEEDEKNSRRDQEDADPDQYQTVSDPKTARHPAQD
jgi:AcrR family transcriptional regulator